MIGKYAQDFGIQPKYFISIVSILVVLFVFPQSLVAIYIGLTIYALRGPKEAIQALTISFLFVFLNPGLFTVSGNISILRWFVLFAAFGRVILTLVQTGATFPKPVLALGMFSLFVFAMSFFSSYAPEISILKLVQFTIGVMTVLYLFHLSGESREYWIGWFQNFFLVVILLSLPLYVTEYGYLRNQRGFQGILTHPQSLGVFIAPYLALFTVRYLYEGKRSIFDIILVLGSLFILYTTQARVGLFAVVLGVGLGLFYSLLIARQKASLTLKISKTGFAAGILVIVFLILNISSVVQAVDDFVSKGREFEGLYEGYEMSRGGLIEKSMENFREHPVTGIGFGIASDTHRIRFERSEMLGMVTGASVEKGFIVSAVLEEIGLFGSAMLLLFIFSLIGFVFSQNLVSNQALLLTCFMVNIGEMVFFSFGGMGLFVWLLIGLSTLPGNPAK